MALKTVYNDECISYDACIKLKPATKNPSKIAISEVQGESYKYLIEKDIPIIDGVPLSKRVEFSYLQCLQTAVSLNVKSVYIPYNEYYQAPKNALREFLFDLELIVYLQEKDVLCYEKSYSSSRNIMARQSACYIDEDFSLGMHSMQMREPIERLSLIERLIKNLDDTFAVMLLKLIDLKGLTDVECYKRANVSKQTWYKILNEKNYRPSKNTVIAFAISLELTLKETNRLLATVGFTLSKSLTFDVIVEYFIQNKVYDVMIINEVLFAYDQPCLGV